MPVPLDDYISAGYLVTQYADGAAPNQWMGSLQHATEDLLPDRIISVGLCDAPRAPIFEWMGPSDEDYARFGISPDRIPELTTWANARFDQEIGYPNVFMNLATGREYINRFTSGGADIQLVGMGLHKDYLGKIAEVERLNPSSVHKSGATIAGFEGTGFANAVKLANSVLPGEILGFDVICLYNAIDHSWHCNGLAVTALREFGFRPNSFGLIADRTKAEKIAAYAEERITEDGVWLPILVTRYALQSG